MYRGKRRVAGVTHKVGLEPISLRNIRGGTNWIEESLKTIAQSHDRSHSSCHKLMQFLELHYGCNVLVFIDLSKQYRCNI